MSTNIHIYGVRDILVIKSNKISVQSIRFEPYQTPSYATSKIMDSENKIQAYIDWVESVSYDEEVNIYAQHDIFHEGEPIGVKTHNVGKEHLDELNTWIEYAVSNNYTVIVKAW